MVESFMSRGLRKGAWTEEEDELLKKCIFKFGEGRWNQVPLQSGLNRCRKSCRMRWLNYLKPNIERGEFKEDEVDLILKLHKLLGNRWSMIAGRIPGRTANDIKNYWNTHLKNTQRKSKKKILIENNDVGVEEKTLVDSNNVNLVKTIVIRPRPRTFSYKNFPWTLSSDDLSNSSKIENKIAPTEIKNDDDKWWESLLFDKDEVNDPSNNNWLEGLLLNKEEDYDFQKIWMD